MDRPPEPADAFYAEPIELSDLHRDTVNVRRVGEGVEVVVIPHADRLFVMREVCPHMGGPLGEAKFCAGDRTLNCPWHGYVFSVETGELTRNPNEQIMAPLRRPSTCFRPER